MSLFNEYFDGVFVLGLQRLELRRREFGRQMRELGIAFEFVEGIDATAVEVSAITEEFQRRGKTLRPPYLLAFDYDDIAGLRRALAERRANPGLVLTPGSLCAGIGHLRVMERIVATRARRALVLEDDAGFADDVESILAGIIADLESPCLRGRWDLVVMGGGFPVADTVPWRSRPDFKPWQALRPPVPPGACGARQEIRGTDGVTLRHVYRAFQEWSGAHCYCVSARCAAFLAGDGYMLNPDGLLARAQAEGDAALKCFVSHPFLAYQVLDSSFIDAANRAILGYDRAAMSSDVRT